MPTLVSFGFPNLVAVYVHAVPWSEFSIVPPSPHYPQVLCIVFLFHKTFATAEIGLLTRKALQSCVATRDFTRGVSHIDRPHTIRGLSEAVKGSHIYLHASRRARGSICETPRVSHHQPSRHDQIDSFQTFDLPWQTFERWWLSR